MQDLDKVFFPRSIAIVGASPDIKSQGNGYVAAHQEHNFSGNIYPVHPTAESVRGIKTYKTILEIPNDVDYVISNVPNSSALELIHQSAKKNVKVIQFFTARFSETGIPEMAELENELLIQAKKYGIRIIGPNCMGVFHPANGMAFRLGMPTEKGNVGFFSQSGGNAIEFVTEGQARGLSFSKGVSYGNALDLNEVDFINYLMNDKETSVIAAYIEGVRNVKDFISSLKNATKIKPVIILKGGRTQAGSRAVNSHTASLAGSKEIWNAIEKQTGIILANNMDELVDLCVTFSFCNPTYGKSVGVVGGGGGRSVASADECEEAGLNVIPFPESIIEEFREIDPKISEWISNPADGSILGGSKLNMKLILSAINKHPEFNLIIGNIGEHFPLDQIHGIEAVNTTTDNYIEIANSKIKPMALVLGHGVSQFEWQRTGILELREKIMTNKVAVYPSVYRAARSLSTAINYWNRIKI